MATKQQTKPAPKPTTAKPTAPPPQKNAVTTTKKNEVADAELLKMMEGDSGRGVSTDASDNIVPLAYILQANSPSLDRSQPTLYLGKDAKAGDIWFRGTKHYVAADASEDDEGLRGIPVYFSKIWIEWRPNRGGFVQRHKDRPEDAVEKLEKKDGSDKEYRVWRRPNGNSVQETREYVVMVLNVFERPRAFVIPMTSTNHTPARAWMSLINEKVVPGTNKAASIYSHEYLIRTVAKSNDEGNWYGYEIVDAFKEEDGSYSAKLVDDIDIYRECKRINDQFNKGELRADVAEASEIDGESRDGGEGGDAEDSM